MSKRAEEAAIIAFPKYYGKIEFPDGSTVEFERDEREREIFIQAYEQAQKDIQFLIETRIAEIIGDAQPRPTLRAELRDLIKRIKEEE